MISFKILTEDSLGSILIDTKSAVDCDADEVEEILSSLLSLCDEDIEVGIAADGGYIFARIFDMGRYSFIYPIDIAPKFGHDAAVELLREYAVKEEIPLVITDVPAYAVGDTAVKFRHMKLDAEDAQGESFRLTVESECSLLRSVPILEYGEITLDAPCEDDVPLMGELNQDEEAKRYWGYDFESDVGQVSDEYFLDTAREEFARGVSLTMAVRSEGRYVGEATLYGFDFKGGAEAAVRILKDYRGRGIGTLAMEALIELGYSLGLVEIFGRVDNRNLPSVRMMDKLFERTSESSGIIYYKNKAQ